MTELVVQKLTVQRGHAKLVDRASFEFRSGELIALLGPNGAGKTTLLRAALGLTHPTSGMATLAGQPTQGLAPSARAKQVSYLPQTRPLAWPSRVRDVVALGRFSHGAGVGRLAEADHRAVTRALESCDLGELAHRTADSLSGGELARVHVARAFAAQAPLLVADEPVAALDPRHQYRVMTLFRSFVDQGGGALIVLHDISIAAQFADRLLWMRDGRIIADGTPSATLTAERLAEVYGVKARVDGTQVQIEAAL